MPSAICNICLCMQQVDHNNRLTKYVLSMWVYKNDFSFLPIPPSFIASFYSASSVPPISHHLFISHFFPHTLSLLLSSFYTLSFITPFFLSLYSSSISVTVPHHHTMSPFSLPWHSSNLPSFSTFLSIFTEIFNTCYVMGNWKGNSYIVGDDSESQGEKSWGFLWTLTECLGLAHRKGSHSRRRQGFHQGIHKLRSVWQREFPHQLWLSSVFVKAVDGRLSQKQVLVEWYTYPRNSARLSKAYLGKSNLR